MPKKATTTTSSDEVIPSNSFQALVLPIKQFGADSIRLVNRCTKPDAKEFRKIALATSIGFLVMGFLGFIVKLVHIPSHYTTHSHSRLTRTHRHALQAWLLTIWCAVGSLCVLLCLCACVVNNIIVGS